MQKKIHYYVYHTMNFFSSFIEYMFKLPDYFSLEDF